MTYMKMKTKLSEDLLRATDGHICKKTKFECSWPKFSFVTAELDQCNQNCLCDPSGAELCSQSVENNEIIDIFGEQNSKFLSQSIDLDKSTAPGKKESNRGCASELETIFSPFLESTVWYGEPNIEVDQGCSDLLPSLGVDDTIHNKTSFDEQACDISHFSIAGMIIASVPFDESRGNCDTAEMDTLSNHICNEQKTSFDSAKQCVILPSLEDKTSHEGEVRSRERNLVDRDGCGLCPVQQMTSWDEKDDFISASQDSLYFDPQFIKRMPELSDALSNFLPAVLPKDDQQRKAVTLVLDLDETLVHSTLEHCNNADFTFTVLFNMKEHTVYVKQRPYLRAFLERVAEMFEVVIFTASQRIYAAKLLDILDPDGKIISRRVYRESCTFSSGSYTKDLKVLGVDLAKVAIIDNSPQVFRLQVTNGIPIQSWFDDPSDNALISLLPFLETLVDADDVRPIIANKFGHKE